MHNNKARLPLLTPPPHLEGLPSSTGDSSPIYFGHPNRPLFGWFHPARLPARAAVGLVVCNPFGNEAVCAHRSLRHLCNEASRSGIAALRFDYDGTGDSAGHDADPERLQAWIESIQLAVEEIKRCAGVEQVCLFGIRLGAALAATAAARRDDVAALIAVAPVSSGKSYVREMRLLQRAINAKRDRPAETTDSTLESAGFCLSAETQAALGTLELNKLERIPAPRVLVLDRAELPGDLRWTQRLREHGSRVECESVTGYTEMMLDSHESVVPEEMIARTIRWIGDLTQQGGPGGVRPLAPATVRQRATLPHYEPADPITGPAPNIAVEECAVRFGDDAALFGIVTVPRQSLDLSGAGHGKAVVLLNSGAVHHIGPNRLYVSFARHLAKKGYTVLRMDIAGIGDSPPRPGEPENVVYSRHALRDIGAAIDYLRSRWNVNDISAIGLCSGAYNAFKAAVAKLPLSGVILINPLTFFWKEGMSLRFPEHRIAADIMRYRENAFRLGSWLKLLRGRVNVWELSQVLARRVWTLNAQLLGSVARRLRIPLKDDLPSELRKIVEAGIRLDFVFADREPGLDLLATQGGAIARRLREKGFLRTHTVPGADHTFTDRVCRVMLVSALHNALSEQA